MSEIDVEPLLKNATIVITDPSEEDILAFSEEMPGAAWPIGVQADFVAARFDRKGNYCTFLQLPQGDFEDDSDQYDTALFRWMEGEFDVAEQTADSGESMTHLDLVRLARAYVTTFSFRLFGKSMVLNLYAISCHKFSGGSSGDGGDDYFYLHETCHFDGGTSVSGYSYEKYWEPYRAYMYGGSKYWVGGGEVCRHYMNEYEVVNKVDPAISEVKFIGCAPQAANEETEITVGTSFDVSGSISAKVSMEGPEAGAALGMGGSFSQSEKMIVKDCSVSSRLVDGERGVSWNYKFRHARQNLATGKWQYLIDPALLSRTLAQFEQHWIWMIPSHKRAENPYLTFGVDCIGRLMSTITVNTGSVPAKDLYCGKDDKAALRVRIEWPALLATDELRIALGKKGGEEKIGVGCEGAWTSSVNESWLHCTPEQGDGGGKSEIFLLADENVTGQTRQARLTIRGSKNSETQTVLVTQYAK